MSFGTALIDSLLGIAVVFLALVLLMVIIKLMTAVIDWVERPKGPVRASVEAVPEKPEHALSAPGSAGEVKLYNTDPRTAALIMAIIADELQVPINELHFISIREVKEEP